MVNLSLYCKLYFEVAGLSSVIAYETWPTELPLSTLTAAYNISFHLLTIFYIFEFPIKLAIIGVNTRTK